MIPAVLLALAVFQQADPSVARKLEDIERRLAATWQKGDCAGWAAMIASEWSVIHITGEVITRAQALEMCKSPAAALASLKVDDLAVRTFGDAAVVTGRTIATTGGEKPTSFELRFTDVFVRRAGEWQVVASHATRIAR